MFLLLQLSVVYLLPLLSSRLTRPHVGGSWNVLMELDVKIIQAAKKSTFSPTHLALSKLCTLAKRIHLDWLLLKDTLVLLNISESSIRWGQVWIPVIFSVIDIRWVHLVRFSVLWRPFLLHFRLGWLLAHYADLINQFVELFDFLVALNYKIMFQL